MSDILRKCLDCGLEANQMKDLELFANVPKGRTAKYNKLNKCRKCMNEYHKLARKKVPKEIRQKKRRERMLKEKYDISSEEFDILLTKQNNSCSICKKKYNDGEKAFCVDHNHKSGRIRGVLCHNCNVAIGNLEDNIINILNAANYLIENGDYSKNYNEQISRMNEKDFEKLFFKMGEIRAIIELIK